MTLYKQFESAINDLENTVNKAGPGFFAKEVIPKLQTISGLMVLENNKNAALQAYLDLYRNDIQLDIENCLLITDESTMDKKEQLLTQIKSHIRPKIKVLEYAFCYYLKDDSLLHAEIGNDRKVKSNSKQREFNEQPLSNINR
ncbi:MAG: hypothetical protein V4717_12275 [Bacteroidota bacterium]